MIAVYHRAKALFSGIGLIHIGSRLYGVAPQSLANIVKGTLGFGAGAIALAGTLRISRGVKEKKVAEMVRGGVEAAAGMAGAVLTYSLDARLIRAAHEASLIALSSSFLAKLGLYDLANGRYRAGLCKIGLGISGIAAAGYYVYSSLPDQTGLRSDQIAFLEAHKDEIEEIYQRQRPVGEWEPSGSGMFKKTYSHPELPGMLIKISSSREFSERVTFLEQYSTNHIEMRKIATNFPSIVIPDSYLYSTSEGPIIVEQMLKSKPSSFYDTPAGKERDQAISEFCSFQEASGLCDADPVRSQNAWVVSNSPVRIGVIDFDCRDYRDYREVFNKFDCGLK